MRTHHWMLGLATIAAALLSVGCECIPEDDDELCGDRQCGETTLIDNCGDERQVDCGDCPDDQDCRDNTCVCEGEEMDALCDQIDADCGVHTTTDQCGDQREIACGGCAPPDECADGQCVCISETDADLCAQQGFDCGEATVEDQCGDSRTVDCGGCTDPDECVDNTCECIGESDDELCARDDLDCGQATVEDQCGETRSIDCGGCTDPDECIDNFCECVGESDDELCQTLDGACGSVSTTDQCGETRELDCGDCPSGQTTFGAVRDGSTGELLDGATIRVYEWPPPESTGHDWLWDTGHRENDPDFSSTTDDDTDGDFNFEFATEESICIDDQIASLEAYEWYRFVVERPGYDPGIYYRKHDGYDLDDCPATCPIDGVDGCNRQDFEIYPDDATYSRYPNLISDVRDLGEHEFQCTLMPPDADDDELIGLRVRLGGANIGPGAFHLEGIADDDQVIQHVERSDGSTDTYTVDSNTFEFYEPHGHIHFMNWFRLALVDPREECRDVDDRPGDCVTHGNDKISFCLHDLEMFDGDVAYFYDGLLSMFPDPPTCDTAEQGITPGWIDVYNRALPGQVLIFGEPDEMSAVDERWIEGEVDPDQVLQEVERDGNVAQLLIDIPDDGDAICADSDRVLDCSVPPSAYDSSDQHRQCGDYLDYADFNW